MTRRGRREFPDAIMQLRFLEHSQDRTMKKLLSTKGTIEKVLAKASKNCHIALQSIKVIKNACDMSGQCVNMCLLVLYTVEPHSLFMYMFYNGHM